MGCDRDGHNFRESFAGDYHRIASTLNPIIIISRYIRIGIGERLKIVYLWVRVPLAVFCPDGVNGSILVSKTSGMGSNPMRGVRSVSQVVRHLSAKQRSVVRLNHRALIVSHKELIYVG